MFDCTSRIDENTDGANVAMGFKFTRLKVKMNFFRRKKSIQFKYCKFNEPAYVFAIMQNIALRMKKKAPFVSESWISINQQTWRVFFLVCVSLCFYIWNQTQFPTNNKYSTNQSVAMKSAKCQFYARFLCSGFLCDV